MQTKLVSRMAEVGMSLDEVKDTLLDENDQPRIHMVSGEEVTFTVTQIQGILANPREYGLQA